MDRAKELASEARRTQKAAKEAADLLVAELFTEERAVALLEANGVSGCPAVAAEKDVLALMKATEAAEHAKTAMAAVVAVSKLIHAIVQAADVAAAPSRGGRRTRRKNKGGKKTRRLKR